MDGTVDADLQYGRPPINGGGDVLMLASSHALTSLMTPESGRGGRGGGYIVRRGDGSSMLMGIGGIGGVVSGVDLPSVGAVCGRLSESSLLTPPSPLLSSTCRDAGFQSLRCSRFFTVSCLLGADNALVAVDASIAVVARGYMFFRYVRWYSCYKSRQKKERSMRA